MAYLSLYKLFVSNDYSEFEKIYNNRLNSESTFKMNVNIHDYPAFVFCHKEIANLIYKIREIDKKVGEAFENLPPVAKKQYIKKSLIQEVEMTNLIEGVISTRKEINEILEDISTNTASKNRIKGIVNKYMFLTEKKETLISNAYSIRKLFDEILYEEIKESDLNNLPDGVIFRSKEVYVYRSSDKVIHKGITPEAKIIEYIEESIKFLNDDNVDMLIRISVFHYLFGYIHPFYDGNGRINRLISSYYLSFTLHPIVAYRMSMTIKENYTQYLKAFEHTNDVRNRGDIGTFVYSFLDLVYKSLESTVIYAQEKKKELDQYKEFIENINLNLNEENLLFVLVQCSLFSEFGLSIEKLCNILEISSSTIRKIIKSLIEKGFIKEDYIGKKLFYNANLNRLK